MTSWTVSIYLLKEEVKDYEAALKDEFPPAPLTPRGGDQSNAVLYVKTTDTKPPPWKKLLSEGFDLEQVVPDSASTSAVLFLEVKGRKFALTFGHGHAMLDDAKLVHYFGLKASLGMLDASELRSVDAVRLEATALRKRHQTGRFSHMDELEINLGVDFLRSATGRSKDPELAKMVTGAIALKMTAELDYSTLPSKCERALAVYESSAYRKSFSAIDNLLPETDPVVIRGLDEQLVAAINARKLEQIILAPPKIIEHGDLLGFRPKKIAEFKYDLSITDYPAISSARPIDLKKLRSAPVYFRREGNDDTYRGWNLYNCIIFECVTDNQQYVLAEGAWYCISRKFQKQVNKFFQGRVTGTRLPNAKMGEPEEDYCKRAGSRAGIFSFDCKTFHVHGTRSSYELCDLLTNKLELVHIKSASQQAKGLSHLFRQGVMAGELFRADPKFRAQAREHIKALRGKAELIPADTPDTRKYTVCFGIIAERNSAGGFDIPFFSKLSFQEAANRLTLYGYKVNICFIERETQ